jgi:hypothetical protein
MTGEPDAALPGVTVSTDDNAAVPAGSLRSRTRSAAQVRFEPDTALPGAVNTERLSCRDPQIPNA